MSQDHENRLLALESQVQLLNVVRLEAEGRVHSLQSALFAIIEFAEDNADLVALIRRNAEISTVVALNSGEDQVKADAADEMNKLILSMLPTK